MFRPARGGGSEATGQVPFMFVKRLVSKLTEGGKEERRKERRREGGQERRRASRNHLVGMLHCNTWARQ